MIPNWDYIVCLVEFGGHNLNGFTPNSTGQIRPGIKYWSNWVEIHWDYICMPAWSNWVSSQWIYTQFEGGQILSSPGEFDRALNTGQIGWKFTEITFVCLPGRIRYHLSGFTPNLMGGSNSIPPVKFDPALNTGQIGWKFTEITFVCLPGRIWYHLSGFTPNLMREGVKFYPPQSNSTRH